MKPAALLPALLLVLVLTVSPASATGNLAAFNVTVPPQQFKALRVKNLPKGAVVGVAVESSRPVTVAFVDSADYGKLPNPERPLMVGKVDRKLQFSVTIPADGHYYVVLVNPDKAAAADVKLAVKGDPPARDPVESADRVLREFEQQMHRILVFDSFPIGTRTCGRPQAFYGVDGFFLCAEYVELLYEGLGDRQTAVSALAFSIFHELSLELMQQWRIDSPLFRDTADELAAVLLVMLNQSERLRELAEHVSGHPEQEMFFREKLPSQWHPLSPPRARRLAGWLENPKLARKWQKTLVPHMQIELLRHLQQKPTEWSDTALVAAELARRNAAPPKPPPPAGGKSEKI